MYTYTDPKVDIGVGLEDEPFDIEKLEDHFKECTKVTEVYHQMRESHSWKGQHLQRR